MIHSAIEDDDDDDDDYEKMYHAKHLYELRIEPIWRALGKE